MVRAELLPKHHVFAGWDGVRVVVKVDRPDHREVVQSQIDAWLRGDAKWLIVPAGVEVTLYEATTTPIDSDADDSGAL